MNCHEEEDDGAYDLSLSVCGGLRPFLEILVFPVDGLSQVQIYVWCRCYLSSPCEVGGCPGRVCAGYLHFFL